MATHNKMLGQFNLEGIPAAARGVPQIEVSFDIDANGIVKVSAKDKATGTEQAISIKASGGLDDGEIEDMIKDAETYAEEDKARREEVEARNRAEALVHTAEKTMSDLGDKADAAVKAEVESGVADLKTALEGDDAADIAAKAETLSAAMMKMGEAAYQSESEAGDADASANNNVGDDGVVDAEFEEVEDDQDAKKA